MKVLASPIPILSLVVAVLLLILGQPLLAAVAFLVWVGALAFGSMRLSTERREEDPAESMDPESRSLFAPIRRLTNEVDEMVSKNRDSALMRTIGAEARTEAERIRDQVARALVVRGELRRAIRNRSVAEAEAQKLEAEAAAALTPSERDSLRGAAEARRLELEHYRQVDETIVRIDTGVRQAEAALSEMKARLAVGAGGEAAARAEGGDDLRETMSRMRALSLSVDEAEQILRNS
jgi:hypothetical protein